MSRLAEFRHLEQQLARQMAELDSLKNDEGLKREIEFETKLCDLLGEYDFSLKHVINVLDPLGAARAAPKNTEKTKRKSRTLKIYKNPHSGETVQTKGGNHAMLKNWKAEYGAEEVESWLQA